MEEEQQQELTIKKAPFTAASIRSVAKQEGCSISGPVFTVLTESVPKIVRTVPRDKVWATRHTKLVMCSKEYFKFYLGKEGLVTATREIIRKNTQILLTNVIVQACKVTKSHKKKIVSKDDVECFVDFFTNQCEDTNTN